MAEIMSFRTMMTEDNTDPATPAFWEAVHALAKRGIHLDPPVIAEPEFKVPPRTIRQEIALLTPTQLMPVVVVD